MEQSTELGKLITAVKSEIANRENHDRHSGAMKDSAAQLRQQLKFYEMGLNKLVPAEWNEIAMTLDPEYTEYIRLCRKFEKRRDGKI